VSIWFNAASIAFLGISNKVLHMKKTTVLDRLIHKPVTLEVPDSVDLSSLKSGDYIVYKDDEDKTLVGEYLWYVLEKTKKGTFSSILSWKWLDDFKSYQEKSLEFYKDFKKEFWWLFPDSVPITAKASLYWDQYYFYFYAEWRYNFADFVRSFREKVKKKFFIYQVWARDRVRLHPNRHEWFDASWLPLMYSIFRHPLEMVDSDTVHLQWIDWRDPERLKDWSGKYDHTLAFEKEFYEKESKRYPQRWWIIRYNWEKAKCVWNNYLTQEIKLRGKSEHSDDFRWEWMVITLDEYLQDKKKKQW